MRLPAWLRLPVSRHRHAELQSKADMLREYGDSIGRSHQGLLQRNLELMAERDKAHRHGYAEGMRWTCHQAGHPMADLGGQCICGMWAHHVEAGAVEVEV